MDPVLERGTRQAALQPGSMQVKDELELTCIHGNVETLALLPKEIRSRHFDIIQHDSTGWLGIPTQFFL